MPKPWMPASLLISLALLTGCASPHAVTADPRPFLCPDDGRPAPIRAVSVSRQDKLTEATATEIEANNLAIEALCGQAALPPLGPGKADAPVKAPAAAKVVS